MSQPDQEQQSSALRANESIARNLRTLGITGLGLIGALVVTLLAVQLSLGAQLRDLETQGVGGALVIARLEAATGSLHSRQTQLVGTTTAAELAAAPGRGAGEAELHEAIASLKELHPDQADEVEAQAQAFLAGDDALYESLQQRHALGEASTAMRKDIEAELRTLIESAMGLSGVARLETVLLLRRLNQNLGSPSVAREVIFGDGRIQQEAVAEVVRGVLGLGGLIGKVGLAYNTDTLNGIVANELPQNAAATRHELANLVEVTARDAHKQAQAVALQEQWEDLFAQVAAESGEPSLVTIQRDIIAQQGRALSLREQAEASTVALQAELDEVDAETASAIATARGRTEAVVWLSRLATAVLVVMGVVGVLVSRRRIQGSVEALQTSNHELERMGQELADINANLEDQVRERTAQLAAREASMRLILDSTGDGLVRLDLAGRVVGEASQSAVAWLGTLAPGQEIAARLFPDEPARAEELELGLEQFVDDFLPFELIAEQLPSRLSWEGAYLGLSWRPVHEDDALVGVLLVISDITAMVEGERAEQRAKELQIAVGQLLKNPSGFQLFLKDGEGLLGTIVPSSPREEVLRALHTVKGNCSLMGFLGVARMAHHIEDVLAEDAEATISAEDAAQLQGAWREALALIEAYIQKTPDLEITPEDVAQLLSCITHKRPHGELQRVVERWKLTPARVMLNRLADQSQGLARRLEKPVEVWTDPGLVRLEERFTGFFSSLVHVVRNAIDHGIEDEAERVAQHKPPVGQLHLQVRDGDDAITVEVQDDGRGIDWEALRQKGQARGLPVRTREDLIGLLFMDGLSTRDQVSDVSGRGVGLGAVRALVASLSGSTEVISIPGRGTTFRFSFPRTERKTAVA